MKHRYIALLIACLACCVPSVAQNVYVDSLTGARLMLPESAEVTTVDSLNTIILPQGSMMFVRSYKNSKNEPYTWPEVSSIDRNNFDDLVEQTPVGNDLDGWHRLYRCRENGRDVYYLMTLIRGNDNALCLMEVNSDSLALQSVDIVRQSELPRFTRSERHGRINGWIILISVILAFSCFLIGSVRQSWSGKVKVLIGVGVFAGAFLLGAWLTNVSYTGVFWISAVIGIIWLGYLFSNNSGNFFEEIVEKIIDSLT